MITCATEKMTSGAPRCHRLLGSALALLAILVASPALAQSHTGGSLDHRVERRVSAELAFGMWDPTLARYVFFGTLGAFASGRLAVLGSDARGLSTLELDGTLRGYFGETYDISGTATRGAIGGSTLALMFGWTDRASFRVRVGPAFVVPLAMINGARPSTEAMSYYAHALLGFWDAWDGFVRGPSALIRADADARFGPLMIGLQLAGGASLWAVRDEDVPGQPQAFARYQLALYAGVEVLDWLALGARVQVAGWSDGGGQPRTEGRPAAAQASVIPFARFLVRPGFVELRFTANVGDPEGVESRSVVWAGRVLGGVEL